MRTSLLLTLLLLPATVFAQAYTAPAPSATDRDYCNQLATMYIRYLGRSEESSYYDPRRGSNDTQVAAAQCREGITAPAIPVLERVLRNNGFTLPPRG